MRIYLVFLFMLVLLATPTLAKDAVVLPIEMPGHFNPLDSEALTRRFKAKVSDLVADSNIQVATAAELTARGYRAGEGRPPSLEQAREMAHMYESEHVVWISVDWEPNYQRESGSLALAGAARVWVYDRDDRMVETDRVLSLVRTCNATDVSDREEARKTGRKLAVGCIDDLGYQIAALAKQRQQQARKRCQSWTYGNLETPEVSRNYREMVLASERYQKAARANNFIDISQAEQQMNRVWVSLSVQERQALARDYPGIQQMMETPGIGGGWWWGW